MIVIYILGILWYLIGIYYSTIYIASDFESNISIKHVVALHFVVFLCYAMLGIFMYFICCLERKL